MRTTYKITYEHRDGSLTKAEEAFIKSEKEPTDEVISNAVKEDIARFQKPETAEFSVISVVPVP